MGLHLHLYKKVTTSVFAAGILFAMGTAELRAVTISDPAGDFLPSYSGPRNGDLDVLSAQVFFNGSNFLFTSTQAAPIGTTTGGLYVWGIDRGAGTAGFPTIAPGVTFDSVFVISPSGASSVRDLVNNVSTPISNITVSGSTVSGSVPLSALPSLGKFAPSDYLVNLWPRSGAGGNEMIADFAPNNSDAAVTSLVPEPSSMSLVGAIGLTAVGLLRRRKKTSAQ